MIRPITGRFGGGGLGPRAGAVERDLRGIEAAPTPFALPTEAHG